MIACEDYDEDGCAWSRRETARIKQIQIGKARPEYQRYVREVVPGRRTGSQPSTPDPRARVSKRQFDRALGDWRRRLHEFDAVPRGPPRSHQAELEAQWSTSGQEKWSSSKSGTGAGQNRQEYEEQLPIESGRNGPRSGNRRSRATPVPPRAERSGKFGPRKPLESPEMLNKDMQQSDCGLLPPPPPPPTAQASATGSAAQGVVRISLADQLMEIPMQPMMPQVADWQWYQSPEAPWGSMETPQKMADMQQFMAMEGITPDKLEMPGYQMYDQSMMKADSSYSEMPMEGYMLPHRLFDSSPEKSEPLGLDSSNSETTTLESSGGSPERDVKAPSSPRAQSAPPKDSLMPLRSPCAFKPHMLSPNARCLASPTPKTPQRQCYMPETPSPDRMHMHASMPNSWLQQPTLPYGQPATFGGIPMNPMGLYGQQAHDSAFLQMMAGMPSMEAAAQFGGEL